MVPLAVGRNLRPLPYPGYLGETRRLTDGTEVLIRPIRPEDEGIELAFIRGLSRDSGYNRLLSARKLTREEIWRLTRIDYEREMAFVAITGIGAASRLLGVARYVRDRVGGGAEFAVVVADAWQRKGVGTLLLQALQDHARAAGVARLHGITFATNQAMQYLGRKFGFEQRADPEDATVRLVERQLAPESAGSAHAAANDERIAPCISSLSPETAEGDGRRTA